MKNFLKNIFLVVLVVLLLSSLLNDEKESIKTSLENDMVIVDKGEALSNGVVYDEEESFISNRTPNIFSKIGQMISSVFILIIDILSSIIGKVFIYIPYSIVAF